MKKRLVSLLLTVLIVVLALPAYAEDAAAPDLSERKTITIGWMFLGDSKDVEGWPVVPAKAIEDKFNVELVLKNYDNETLNLDLAAGTLPDIVQINPQHVDNVLKGKFALALDPYLDTLASNIAELSVRNEMMRKFRSNGDGHLYFRTPQSGVELATNGSEVNSPYRVRWNLYKQLGMPQIENDDQYIDVLLKMRELYPQTEAGLPVYAEGIGNDMGIRGWIHRGNVKLGYQQIATDYLYQQSAKTNDLISNVYNTSDETPFWDSMRYYNKLYRNGLLDPDSFIMKREDVDAKVAKGQYLSESGVHANPELEDYDPLEGDVCVPGYYGWYGCDFKLGWADRLFFVNAKGPNIERALMVMDYLDSEEFARINFSGIQGVHWDYVDGKPTLLPETIQAASDPEKMAEWQKLEINFWRFGCMVGRSGFTVLKDGGYASLWEDEDIYAQSLSPLYKDVAESYNVKYPGQAHLNKVAEDERYFNMSNLRSEIFACIPTPPSRISRIDKACEEAAINAIPSLVMAESDEEFAAARETLLSQLKDLNADESEAWWMAEWETAREFVNSIL